MSFQALFDFEEALANYTGAPYAVVTDGCTHALELCFRYEEVTTCELTAYTYLSVPQMLRQLGIHYRFRDETWSGEYLFHGTRIWDSARRLEPGMYRSGQLQCLSFGWTKPMQLGKVGAILLDSAEQHAVFSRWRSDGRDLRIVPWQDQQQFGWGFHYCPTLESCQRGLAELARVQPQCQTAQYPDLRTMKFDYFPL